MNTETLTVGSPPVRVAVRRPMVKEPIFLGIDPGMSGAIGIIRPNGSVVSVIDMPVITVKKSRQTREGKTKTKKRRHLDAPSLAGSLKTVLESCIPILCVLEHVHSMPKQGLVTTSVLMRAFGIIEGILATLEIPVELHDPASWKRIMLPRQVNAGKQASIVQVRRTLPDSKGWVTLAKHDGRAEALLLAEYARRINSGR